jgi:hypothetical protein
MVYRSWIPLAALALIAGGSLALDNGTAPATADRPPASAAPAAQASLYVENLPGVRTGVVSPAQRLRNSSVINARLAGGAQLHLHRGTRLEIGRSLRIGSGGAIIGEAGGTAATIFMPASAFNNIDTVADKGRYGPFSVGINFSGELTGAYAPSRGVRIENVRLISEIRTGRQLRGIVGQNVSDCLIRNVEVSGFPTAIGITLASARRCRISNVYVHDFSDETAWKVLPQSTGIEIDNDIVNHVPSTDISISDFRIERLRVGGPLLAKWNYQTDGINVMNSRSRVDISNGRISDVGEGIDTFGSFGTIRNVSIANAYIFGLKFIHGASHNQVRNVTITNAGLAAVNFSGSNQASQDTAANVITGLTITTIDPLGTWKENSTAGILVSGRNARRSPVGNEVIGARIDLGPNGKFGWLDDSTGRGNRGSGLEVRGGRALERKVLILHGGSWVGSAPLG